MNLDDFIFADSVSTPMGIGFSPSPELSKKDISNSEKSSNAVASAIPIKMRKESAQFAIPQSVPVPQHMRTNDEFNYVQRHVRKTSIDERRVCFRDIFPFMLDIRMMKQSPFTNPLVYRLVSDPPTSLLMSILKRTI